MKADQIDIQVEDYGNDVEISLSGSLNRVQLSAVREKLDSLMAGPGVFFFLNLENVHFSVDDYLEMFLDLLNRVKERNSTMVLIFRNEEQLEYFYRYRNIFEIYDSRESYKNSGLSKQLKQVGVYYGKKTGLRLSPSVAIAAAVLITGWIVTLFLIIAAQGKDIADKQAQIMVLQGQRERYILAVHRANLARHGSPFFFCRVLGIAKKGIGTTFKRRTRPKFGRRTTRRYWQLDPGIRKDRQGGRLPFGKEVVEGRPPPLNGTTLANFPYLFHRPPDDFGGRGARKPWQPQCPRPHAIWRLFGCAGPYADQVGNGKENGLAFWTPCGIRRGFVQAGSERDGGYGLPDKAYWQVWFLERGPGRIQLGAFCR